MKCPAPLFSLMAFVLLTPIAAFGQDPPPPPAPPSVPRLPRVVLKGNQQQEPELLERNYQVRLVVTQGDKVSEFVLLTASSTITFNGSSGSSPATVVTMSGTLRELEGGGLVLKYSVGGRIPVMTGEGPQRRVEYNDETSSGAIYVTPGKAQSLIKSGDRSYSVTVTPAENE